MKVWVNGTFDVLHIGHLKLLEFASSFGELRVGIDTDKRVKELKSPDRPFNTTEDRKYFLESLKFVKDVVVFDSRQELIDLVKEYQPDEIILLPLYPQFSTTTTESSFEDFYKKLKHHYQQQKALNAVRFLKHFS